MTVPTAPAPDSRVQPKALAWTVGIHALLLLLFFGVHYTVPQQPPPAEELGMEVNLGTDADGSGADQPERTGDPADASPVVATAGSTPATSNTPDLVRSDEADAPPVPARTTRPAPARSSTPAPTRSATPSASTTAPTTPRPQRPRYIYRGGTAAAGGNGAATDRPGSSEGNTTGPGDRGVPGGTPGASNYEGSPGTGTGGIGHTLTGRRIIAPRLEGSFRNGGTVRIRVTVNRAGTIVNSTVLSGSGELVALAREKLALIHFSPSPDGPVEQIGTLTFAFKTGG